MNLNKHIALIFISSWLQLEFPYFEIFARASISNIYKVIFFWFIPIAASALTVLLQHFEYNEFVLTLFWILAHQNNTLSHNTVWNLLYTSNYNNTLIASTMALIINLIVGRIIFTKYITDFVHIKSNVLQISNKNKFEYIFYISFVVFHFILQSCYYTSS